MATITQTLSKAADLQRQINDALGIKETAGYKQLQVQTTFRPEQFALQDELRKRGIESELEVRVWRPGEFRCEKHHSFEIEDYDNGPHGDHVAECPLCQSACCQMFYQVDLMIPSANVAVELKGSIHGKKGMKRRDEKREAKLAKRGICVLSFPSKKSPAKIADEIQEELARKE